MSDEIDRDNLYEIVLVFNGGLEMSPGKMVGQAFQAAHRNPTYHQDEAAWKEQGTRTIVKVAKTTEMFLRVMNEVDGWLMVDEGFTEVDSDSPTLWVTNPFLHKYRPKILDNKKVKLL